VLDPIAGQGGVSVVKITDKQLQSLDDSRAAAEELATQALGTSFTTWLQQARAGASISVDPRYGTFDKDNFTINAPPLDVNSGSDASSPPDSASGNP
jgi:hypothetical protein